MQKHLRYLLFLSAVSLLCAAPVNQAQAQLMGYGSPTYSAGNQSLPPGCAPEQWEAMTASAQAWVAHDKATHEEVVTQSDSVLATSCFDQAARVSASEGGNIFSGPFVEQMAPVVLQPMQNMLNNNFLGSIGNNAQFGSIVTNALGGLLAGLFGGLFSGQSYDCTVQQDLFDAAVSSPTNRNIKMPTGDELIKMALQDSINENSRYEKGIGASKDIMENLQQKVDRVALPQTMDFSNVNSFDGVLELLGVGQ